MLAGRASRADRRLLVGRRVRVWRSLGQHPDDPVELPSKVLGRLTRVNLRVSLAGAPRSGFFMDQVSNASSMWGMKANGLMSSNSRLARDTQSLRWPVLTPEEIKIINNVNNLILAIKKAGSGKHASKEYKGPWSAPEMDRYNNVFMLDGARGSGKTSLLLTLITGWHCPGRLSAGETVEVETAAKVAIEVEFTRMSGSVFSLKPLDFDPLPPDLPLYNWIIQAFEPLVNGIATPQGRLDEWDEIGSPLSLRDRFRRLKESAALGWTTGLLRDAVARDVGDFLVWHGEQQSRWQSLSRDWQLFLDALFESLEAADCEWRIDKGAVIVLPIDDLDLQASRVRELLSALRVLRHGRLVYAITGESKNLLMNLGVEFFRDCTANASFMTDSLQDQIQEESDKLAKGLFRKVVPEPHRFQFQGISPAEFLEWAPTGGKKLATILDDLWKPSEENFSEKLKSIFKHSSVDIKIPFRTIQGFHDRWQHQDNELDGVVDFLEAILSVDDEDFTIVKELKRIEISGPPSRLAPAPRGSEFIGLEGGIRINWISTLDFAASEHFQTGGAESPPHAATPGQRIVLDLAYAFPRRIINLGGPRLADDTLGLIWSSRPRENDEMWLVPWPMLNVPSSPSSWHQCSEEWNKISLGSSPETGQESIEQLLEAWINFNFLRWEPKGKYTREAPLPQAVSEVLAPLASSIYGLPDDLRVVMLKRTGHNVLGTEQSDLEAIAKRRAYKASRSDHNPYQLAMRPSEPNARPDQESIVLTPQRKTISELLRATLEQ